MMRNQRGFTLLEILIAMSLFTLLGFAVVRLMGAGIDMWTAGTRGSQQENRVEQSLPRLEDDLRMVLVPTQRDRIPFDAKDPDPEKLPPALVPDNRFISGYMLYRFGDLEVPCRYIAFVRDVTGMSEIDMYAGRAGVNPKAEEYIDGKKDEEEFRIKNHLPTGGAAEVLWIYLPDEKRPGVGAVYRAYRSPIGGKDTLLDPKNFDSLRKLQTVIRPQPMFQDVILFDVLFWTQYTTNWEWSRDEPRITTRPQRPDDRGAGRPVCGPSRIWDSTRGILVSKDRFGFRLNKGKGSANFSADDIWPRMVRVEFALSEEEAILAQPFGSADTSFTVELATFATGRGELFDKPMKVGGEWLRVYGRSASRRDVFETTQRGIRGTPTLNHAPGTIVRFGRVFDFTISVPSFRDDNN
jgi:prepilin-type N-terminal cleavage/methylation domain-containing protein